MIIKLKKSDDIDSKRDKAERKKLKELSELELDSDGFAYRVRNRLNLFYICMLIFIS